MPLLRIERGEGKGSTFVIEESGTIGRDPQVEVPIADEKASRRHCRILCGDDGYVLEDLDSKNGTSLNGSKITGKVAVEPGDHFRIGLTWFSFGADLLRKRLDGILADYRIESSIEHGSVGEFYQVQQIPLRRSVALKLLPPSLVRGHPEIRERFLSSLKTLATLNHASIPTILDFGSDESLLYFTMEWIEEAMTLSEYQEPGEPLEVRNALGIALSCARALHYAHERGVLHQDVKPENVQVTPWRVMLAHFGLARMLGETGEETGAEAMTGTVEYMSPEQLAGGEVEARSDLYSLGVLLYEMLAGVPPLRGESPYETIELVLNVPPKPLSAMRPDLPPQIALLVARCLEKDPDSRYPTAEALVRDLTKARNQYEILELQSEGDRVLVTLKNEFYVLLGWPLFRWVLFPLLAILVLLLLRLLFFR